MQKVVPVAAHLQRSFSSGRRAENLENGLQEYFDVRARGQSYSSEAQRCQYLLFGVAQILFLHFYHTILKMVRLSPGWARNFSIWSGYWLLCQAKLT